MMNQIKKIYKKIEFTIYKFTIKREEMKKNKSQKKLIKSVSLTNEQIEMVDELWLKNYGKKINKDYHKLYTAYNNVFNAYYFPELQFREILLNKMNPRPMRKYLADKMLTQYLFNNVNEKKVKVAKNYIYNENGYYYSEDGVITRYKSLEIIKDIGEVIIKPTIETSSGHNVALLNIKGDIDVISGEKIENIINRYNKNFTIQEKIIPHDSFKKLNSTSINTLRINTYICDGKVYASPTAMRIGRKGKLVDNAHAGGLTVGIDKNGCLMKYGFLQSGEKYLKHPDNNIEFLGYKIPRYKEMIDFCINNHYRIPNMGIIAWDITLDKEENIVVIETNIQCPSIWFPQYSTGEAFFGENTEKMIQMLKNN